MKSFDGVTFIFRGYFSCEIIHLEIFVNVAVAGDVDVAVLVGVVNQDNW